MPRISALLSHIMVVLLVSSYKKMSSVRFLLPGMLVVSGVVVPALVGYVEESGKIPRGRQNKFASTAVAGAFFQQQEVTRSQSAAGADFMVYFRPCVAVGSA